MRLSAYWLFKSNNNSICFYAVCHLSLSLSLFLNICGSCSSMTLSDDFYPFEFQRSEGGLFVDLNTFLAFGKDYVGWNYERTGNPVYLHIKQRKKLVPEDRPSKKPTLLAIGTFTTFINLI